MKANDLLVCRADLGDVRWGEASRVREPAEGQALVEVEGFALTANNISYAAMGDALGYWAYFPTEDEAWGRVPVWGFAKVVASRSSDVTVGERVFGYLPLSSHLTVQPASASELCFSDATPHRVGLHPWYNRYYRCAADPAWTERDAELQPVLWALFMTGWMLADDLHGAIDEVYVSSASSKTAICFAWSMAQRDGGAPVVGITSAGNRAFVEKLGVYSRVLTYDDLGAGGAGERVAYVDIAGNGAVTSAAHVALGDRLADSVLLGATHRAPASEPLPMPGPAPRFFFIPDVAEARADRDGFEVYHHRFSETWHDFAGWASGWLEPERGSGLQAIEDGYRAALAGGSPPQRAMLLSWR